MAWYAHKQLTMGAHDVAQVGVWPHVVWQRDAGQIAAIGAFSCEIPQIPGILAPDRDGLSTPGELHCQCGAPGAGTQNGDCPGFGCRLHAGIPPVLLGLACRRTGLGLGLILRLREERGEIDGLKQQLSKAAALDYR